MSVSIYKRGATFYKGFTTRSPLTGAAKNADSLPTGNIRVNNAADATAVTIANVTTGKYEASFVVPSTWANGAKVSVYAAITVDGVTDNILVAEFSVESATHSEIGADVLLASDLIESMRGHHTWSGQRFYVAPVNGHDTTGDGSRLKPYKTVTKALSMCIANNHDVIFLVPDDTATPTVLTEDIAFNKSYTFLRGPGRDFKIQSTAGAGKNGIVVSANGVELSGFITSSNGNSGTPIKVSGADFTLIRNVFIDTPTQDCIEINVGTNTIIEDCTLLAPGRDGVRVSSGAGSGFYTRVRNCTLRDAAGSAVNLLGTDSGECQIRGNVIRDCAVGVTVGSGVVDTIITDNRFINNPGGNIVDGGTRTLDEWNTLGEVADTVWDEPLTGSSHNIATSAGRRLRQITASIVLDAMATAGGNNWVQFDGGASTVDGAYDPSLIAIVGGTGAGQCRNIFQYDGATKKAWVDRDWRVNPDATSEVIIYADAGREHVNEGVLQGSADATHVTLNASASASDDIYTGQVIFLRSGTGQDQAFRITAYNGSTKVATLCTAAAVQPDNTTAYTILPSSVTRPNVLAASLIANNVASQTATDASIAAVAALITGSGTRSVTIRLYRTATTIPIPDADVTVMNGLDNVVLTRLRTDANGLATMARNDGTFKLRISCVGYTFTTPETLTVTADATHTFYGTLIAIPAPTTPGTQTLYGNVRRLNLALATGDTVKATIASKQIVGGVLIQNLKLEDTVDANGQFALTVPKGARIRVNTEYHGEYEILVTDDDTKDLADYPEAV